MALTLEDVDRILDQAEPELLQRLKLDVRLTALLVRDGVISASLADTLDAPLLSRMDKVHRFLQDLRMGPIERFLKFCRVLQEDGKPHLLEALHVDFDNIISQLGSTPSTSLLEPAREAPESHVDNRDLFLHQRQFYKEVLSKVPIYEYVMRSEFIQIDDVFTKLELVTNDEDETPHGGFLSRALSRDIALEEMFEEKDSSFLRILLEGKPGSGKTSILKHCGVEWANSSSGQRDSEQGMCGASAPFSLLNKDLVIYVDKSHEKTNLESTIKAALKGPKTEQDKAFQFWQKHPQKTFLMVDGIDEFLNQALVNEIFELASQAGCHLLISCRMGHKRLENQMKNFNRHVKVSGFDPESATLFVNKFMKRLNGNKPENNENTRTLCSFLASDSVQSLYKNPLNCAFVCLLYNNGDVTEEDLASLTLVDLFKKQQECLLKRECVRRTNSQSEADELEEMAQSSVQGIHRMALHSLVHNEKQSSYSQKAMKQFGIDLTSPAMVLLHEEDQIQDKVYTWPHQVIKEFHAARAVQNKTIMYTIASKSELNQLSKFILSYLIDTDIEAAKNLLLAMMLMQSSDPPCSRPKWNSKQSHLGHPCTQISNLRTFLSQRNIDELLQRPLVEFPMMEMDLRVEEIQQCVRHTDWALRNYLTMIQLVEMTLDVSTKEEHYKMLTSVTHPFLPSSFSGSVNQMAKICPWNGEIEGTLQKMLLLGGHGGFELHPVSGRVPLLVLVYLDMGGIAFLVGKAMKYPTSWINILVSSPTDITADTAENIDTLKQFAKGKRGKADVVDICIKHSDWNWDFSRAGSDKEDSCAWKKAIILVNDMFRPKRGVCSIPDYPDLLTEDDLQELRHMGVKILLQSEAYSA